MIERAITRSEWDEHVAEDDARGREINDLKMAMFGNPDVPDTVKQAVMPTMTRLNTYMDFVLLLGKGIVGLAVAVSAIAGFCKTMGWI